MVLRSSSWGVLPLALLIVLASLHPWGCQAQEGDSDNPGVMPDLYSGFEETGYFRLVSLKRLLPKCSGRVAVHLNKTRAVIRQGSKAFIGPGHVYTYHGNNNTMTILSGREYAVLRVDRGNLTFNELGCIYNAVVGAGSVLGVRGKKAVSEAGIFRGPMGDAIPFVRSGSFAACNEMSGTYYPQKQMAKMWEGDSYGSDQTYTQLSVNSKQQVEFLEKHEGVTRWRNIAVVPVAAGSVLGVLDAIQGPHASDLPQGNQRILIPLMAIIILVLAGAAGFFAYRRVKAARNGQLPLMDKIDEDGVAEKLKVSMGQEEEPLQEEGVERGEVPALELSQ